ncbi:MAG: hypothetical protein Q4A54_02185 [Parabacteroides sp.]|nr:hypothetical protein [Parabacteroides sp.]
MDEERLIKKIFLKLNDGKELTPEEQDLLFEYEVENYWADLIDHKKAPTPMKTIPVPRNEEDPSLDSAIEKLESGEDLNDDEWEILYEHELGEIRNELIDAGYEELIHKDFIAADELDEEIMEDLEENHDVEFIEEFMEQHTDSYSSDLDDDLDDDDDYDYEDLDDDLDDDDDYDEDLDDDLDDDDDYDYEDLDDDYE